MKKSFLLTTCLLLFLVIPVQTFATSPLPASSLSKTAPEEYPVLTKAKKPEQVGFSSRQLRKVDQMIEKDIKAGFPGATLIIIKDNKIVHHKAYGYRQKYDGTSELKSFKKMKKDTLFDLASNTKMYATNYALQKLVYEQKLDINEHVQSILSDFKDDPNEKVTGKNKLRVKDLLTHSAGLPSSVLFYSKEAAGSFFSQDRNLTMKLLPKVPLQYEPGTQHIYSDIDYMLLGMIIEKKTGMTLDQYVESTIYKPLGLKHTKFNPLQKGFQPKHFAATERLGNTRDGVITFENIRHHTIIGQVHDEKAYHSMAGISGHAGLFSNISDMAVLLQLMLNDGGYGKKTIFDKKAIDLFTKASDTNPTYGLGWRKNGNADMEWMFGKHASKEAYGHTGWTGTMTLIDPKHQLGVVLLTNKKHSPVISPETNPNQFEGDLFPTGTYGSIMTAIYESLK
ncbi:penicillin binding protein PBP4B [Bacillus sp. NPDC077027]|uniref:penicillin binding protein PBP4B n=1 Tax=Bacillus sp. NPDC077027 TaxID=3390548 RepID=UPI003D00B50C